MSNFAERLKLKELAEEDIYFAKRDRELIEALHNKNKARQAHQKKTDTGPEQD